MGDRYEKSMTSHHMTRKDSLKTQAELSGLLDNPVYNAP